MPRLSVYVPDELHRVLRERLAGLNVSQLLQEAIRERLGCRHAELACARCLEPVDQAELVDRALSRFYHDVMWAFDDHINRGGTAEGAARIFKDVGGRHQISVVERIPLPRPTRAQRERLRVKQAADHDEVSALPREADSRAQHPTARRQEPADHHGQDSKEQSA